MMFPIWCHPLSALEAGPFPIRGDELPGLQYTVCTVWTVGTGIDDDPFVGRTRLRGPINWVLESVFPMR